MIPLLCRKTDFHVASITKGTVFRHAASTQSGPIPLETNFPTGVLDDKWSFEYEGAIGLQGDL